MAKTKYDAETFPQLAEGYAREGLNDEQIAAKLGISAATLYEYRRHHPQFLEALTRGKAPVDFSTENALLKRALGYRYDEVTQEYINGVLTTTKVVTKEVPGDVAAQKLWLSNRRPDRWRDKQDIQHSGQLVNIPYVLNSDEGGIPASVIECKDGEG